MPALGGGLPPPGNAPAVPNGAPQAPVGGLPPPGGAPPAHNGAVQAPGGAQTAPNGAQTAPNGAPPAPGGADLALNGAQPALVEAPVAAVNMPGLGGGRPPNYVYREGDWACGDVLCMNINHSFRTDCNRCHR